MKSLFGSLMLLLTATIWGVAFVAQSVGMDYVGPFTFSFTRYILGAVVLLPFVIVDLSKNNKKKQLKDIDEKTEKSIFSVKTSIIGGLICGVVLFTASILQQFGINYSDSVGKCGFITALYIVMVPLIYICMGKKYRFFIWLAVPISVIGMFLLCVNPAEGFKIGFAEILVMISAVFFSIHIIIVDSIIRKSSGVTISAVQFFMCFMIGLVFALIFEKPTFAMILKGWVPICYAGVLSCGVAYTLQILGQKHVEPAKASLIMCLESVISAIAGWILLGQVLSVKEIIGCVVVFAGIILAQFSGE